METKRKKKELISSVIFFIIAFIALVLAIALPSKNIRTLREQRDTYKSNMTALMQQVDTFRVNERMQAAKVKTLQLTLDEFRDVHAEDLETIKEMGIKQKDLQQIADIQSQTIINLQGNVKDSIVFRDRHTVDTLRCISIHDRWYDLQGCSNKAGDFAGTFVNRDSILVLETVKYKRFLGFLWKTKKVKDRHLNIVSRNPYTHIIGMQHIIIEK